MGYKHEHARQSYRMTYRQLMAITGGQIMKRTQSSQARANVRNLCAKTRPVGNPYEIWQSRDGAWTWKVLKKWQVADDKLYARWFCFVTSPFCPEGEYGDTYVKDIKAHARCVAIDPEIVL